MQIFCFLCCCFCLFHSKNEFWIFSNSVHQMEWSDALPTLPSSKNHWLPPLPLPKTKVHTTSCIIRTYRFVPCLNDKFFFLIFCSSIVFFCNFLFLHSFITFHSWNFHSPIFIPNFPQGPRSWKQSGHLWTSLWPVCVRIFCRVSRKNHSVCLYIFFRVSGQKVLQLSMSVRLYIGIWMSRI